jgi:hypothetical protein
MTKHSATIHQIEIRIRTLDELFNSMDPTPFHHRDLDNDAQVFIESWAMNYPPDSHFRVIVHIAEMPEDDPEPVVREGIHNYFALKALLNKRNIRLLLIEGRTSLLIGLGFLALCLIAADLLNVFGTNAVSRVFKEGLLICGWVAMWRPMQIFLHEWWPLVRRGRIYRALGTSKVHVVPASPVDA